LNLITRNDTHTYTHTETQTQLYIFLRTPLHEGSASRRHLYLYSIHHAEETGIQFLINSRICFTGMYFEKRNRCE